MPEEEGNNPREVSQDTADSPTERESFPNPRFHAAWFIVTQPSGAFPRAIARRAAAAALKTASPTRRRARWRGIGLSGFPHDMRGQWLHVPKDWPGSSWSGAGIEARSTSNSFDQNSMNCCAWPPRSMTVTDPRPFCSSAMVQRQGNRNYIAPCCSNRRGCATEVL
jgi:hypothetical protein